MPDQVDIFALAIAEIVQPLARLALKRGMPFDAFSEVVKRTFVEVAEQEFQLDGRKQTKSRIATLTGINRKEVARVLELAPLSAPGSLHSERNRAAKVLSAWLRDQRFLDRKGDPRDLPFEGSPSFSELVKDYSGDIPPRAIADELCRVGAIEETEGRLRLANRGYVPESGREEHIEILGTDSRELIETIAHNIESHEDAPLFQRKVCYNDIPVEYLSAFRALSGRLAQHLLEELDRWLADHDRGLNPTILGSGRARAGLGIYQIEEILEEEDDNQ